MRATKLRQAATTGRYQSLFGRKGALVASGALMRVLLATFGAFGQVPLGQSPRSSDLNTAIAVQERNNPALFAIDGVVGTGVGLSSSGSYVIRVLTETLDVKGVPATLEGIPVIENVTGELVALPKNSGGDKGNNKGGGGTGGGSDPKKWFPRPVPIGVSTSHELPNTAVCFSGTIGARVRDATGNVYSLSNNHVYATENATPTGRVVQPGLADSGCKLDSNNAIGEVSDFEPLLPAANYVDAAIAKSDTNSLGNSTPPGGYGTPKSQPVDATQKTVGMAVQKYGRTTKLTQGVISGVNMDIRVLYLTGPKFFEDQIAIFSSTGMALPGDSGSLVVTAPDAAPVGLLFAGESNGRLVFANPIRTVLNSFEGRPLTIDGA